MNLDTARLHLRPFVTDDQDALYAAVYSDPDVMVYLPGGVPRTRERTAEVVRFFVAGWAQHGYGVWALRDRAMGAFVGQCGLSVLPNGETEVLYALGKPWWGRGLASEAAAAAVDFGFRQAELAEIVALAVPENTASRRVMEKLGMTFEGIRDDYYSHPLAVYRLRAPGTI